MCPGNNESAGKRRNGRMNEGDKWLKAPRKNNLSNFIGPTM
jgi:hypothetical protein